MAWREPRYTDTFTRTNENPLSNGGKWNGNYTSLGNLQVVGNRARVITAGVDSLETVNSPLVGGDQFAYVEFASLTVGASSNSIQLALRWAASPTVSGYLAIMVRNLATFTTDIRRFDAGSNTVLARETATTWAAGDNGIFEAQGQRLKLYRNGTLLLEAADEVYTSGRYGLWMFDGDVPGNVEAANFIAGDLYASKFNLVRS